MTGIHMLASRFQTVYCDSRCSKQSLSVADLAPEIDTAQTEPRTQPEVWAIQAFQFAGPDVYNGIPAAKRKAGRCDALV